jgi:hypothetical protein
MADEILRKYMSRGGLGTETDADSDAEGQDDFGAFGWLRGVRDRRDGFAVRFPIHHTPPPTRRIKFCRPRNQGPTARPRAEPVVIKCF